MKLKTEQWKIDGECGKCIRRPHCRRTCEARIRWREAAGARNRKRIREGIITARYGAEVAREAAEREKDREPEVTGDHGQKDAVPAVLAAEDDRAEETGDSAD